MKTTSKACKKEEMSAWASKVREAIRNVQLELSPGIELIPPPEWRVVFRCVSCKGEAASFIKVVSEQPPVRVARCGICAHSQHIFD